MFNVKVKFPNILAILFPLSIYFTIIVAILNAPWFDFYDNALSDLGVHEGSALIFNTGIFLSGLIYGFYGLMKLKSAKNMIDKTGRVILLIAGVSLALVGVFPKNIKPFHTIFAWGFFILFPIGAVMTSIKARDKDKAYWFLAMISLITFLLVITFPWKAVNVTGLAIPELVASTPYVLWHLYEFLKQK